MSSGEGKKVFEAINKFRKNPSYIGKTAETLRTGIVTMNPKNEMGKRLGRFLKKLNKIEPTKSLKMSPELCKAAENYLKEPFERGKKEGIILYRGHDLHETIPEDFEGNNTLLIDSDAYDGPEQALVNMLMDKGDPEMEDGSYLARRMLISDVPTQVGVAAEDDDESGKFCVILSEDPVEKNNDYVPKGAEKYDLTELRLAFEDFDFNKENRVDIHKVCELAKQMGKEMKDPTLVNMLNELDESKKNKYISWPEFADFFTEKMTDNGKKDRREEIYDILKPDENYESIDYAQLKDIRNKIKLKGFQDPKIKKMLNSNTESRFGVSFQDYCDNLDKKNGPLPEYKDIQPDQPKKKKK